MRQSYNSNEKKYVYRLDGVPVASVGAGSLNALLQQNKTLRVEVYVFEEKTYVLTNGLDLEAQLESMVMEKLGGMIYAITR